MIEVPCGRRPRFPTIALTRLDGHVAGCIRSRFESGLSTIMVLRGRPADDRDAGIGRMPRPTLHSQMLKRAVAVWCLIFVLEVIHGVLRTIWLVPRVGDLHARQVGVLVGSLLILVVSALTIRWIGARRCRDLLRIGLLWVVLMVGAEILLGRVVFGYPWSRIAEDFDVTRGGLLGFGMLVLAAAPWLASRLFHTRSDVTE